MYAKKLSDIAFNIFQALNFFLINVIYLIIFRVKSKFEVLIIIWKLLTRCTIDSLPFFLQLQLFILLFTLLNIANEFPVSIFLATISAAWNWPGFKANKYYFSGNCWNHTASAYTLWYKACNRWRAIRDRDHTNKTWYSDRLSYCRDRFNYLTLIFQ